MVEDNVYIIVTVILEFTTENLQDRLLKIQDTINKIDGVREFGFNIYDLNDPKLEK